MQKRLLLAISLLFIAHHHASGSILCDLEQTIPKPHSNTQTNYRANAVELVVSWCHEDISWITQSEILSTFDAVFLYSKCNGSLPRVLESQTRFHFTTLPNVGNCDHSYIHHIITQWFSLADVTVFYKGREEERCPPVKLAAGESRDGGLVCCRDHDELAIAKDQFREGFNLRVYRTKNNPILHERYHRYSGNLGSFLRHLFGHANAKELFLTGRDFCHGGYFAISSKVIRRHSIAVYEAMILQQKFPREEVDHYIERLWTPLSRVPAIHCRDTSVDVPLTPSWIKSSFTAFSDLYVAVGKRAFEKESI
jgi:hypothetical protein